MVKNSSWLGISNEEMEHTDEDAKTLSQGVSLASTDGVERGHEVGQVKEPSICV